MEDRNKKLVIGYLINPDKVFFDTLDDKIIQELEENDAIVKRLTLEGINFKVNSEGIEIYHKNRKLELDGFLNYGFMSGFHHKAFMYIISAFESMGIPCLHSTEAEKVLNDKFLQSLYYSKHGISIPTTNIGFSIESFKCIAGNCYPNHSILKKIDDYGGDGVSCYTNKENLVNGAAKLLWNREYSIFQEFVKDCPGKSIRVLCIDGKAVACAEYNDKTNNFKSNSNYGYELFSLDSLMDNPRLKEFTQLAEKTVSSIGHLTIAGVDILDSNEHGLLVLETNGWPDIYDISESTKVDIFSIFAKAFVNKVKVVKKAKENIILPAEDIN